MTEAVMSLIRRAEQEEDVDLWQLAGVPGGMKLASYLTVGGGTAAQYRLIVDVLLDEQQHSLTGVSEAELDVLIRDRLDKLAAAATAQQLLADFSLPSRMEQLAKWGVVDQWDDRATDKFLNNAYRYQLTAAAAQFHRAIRRLGEDTATSVAATFAPSVLTSQLTDMCAALLGNPRALAEGWSVVRTTLDAMAEAAADWQATLAGAMAGAADAEKVSALQDTLRRYIDVWGAGVDSHSDTITVRATELLDAGHEGWRPAVLHSLGAEATDGHIAALTSEYHVTFTRLLSWFGKGDNASRRLRRQMRDVIAPMVRGQRTLAAVGGHVSRRSELLTLASALERAATDNDAWSLWCTATGLFSASHLARASPQPPGASGSVSFWDADPVPVEARLRKHGARALTGRPARIPDRSAAKAAARANAAADRETAARTRNSIQARSGLRLSGWAGLDGAQLDTLLSFLAALAGAKPGPDGIRTIRTPDGLWDVRADPPPAGEASAVIRTPYGRIVHPNLRLTIVAASGAIAVSAP
jgi:uncharacterized protein (TIGR02677 family)